MLQKWLSCVILFTEVLKRFVIGFGCSSETAEGGSMDEREKELRIAEIKRQIAQLPIGTVVYKKIKGKEQPYLQWSEAGKTKSKYIKLNEREEVFSGIARKKQLVEELKRLASAGAKELSVKEMLADYGGPAALKGTAR